MRCREYAIIHPEIPTNQDVLKSFEAKHRGHTVVTLDISEVRGSFKNFQSEGSEESEAPTESSE